VFLVSSPYRIGAVSYQNKSKKTGVKPVFLWAVRRCDAIKKVAACAISEMVSDTKMSETYR
jgi:hypothetical protein